VRALAQEEEDERRDEAEADRKRERNDGHGSGGRGGRFGGTVGGDALERRFYDPIRAAPPLLLAPWRGLCIFCCGAFFASQKMRTLRQPTRSQVTLLLPCFD
jgi:hypothetical protein